MVWIWLVHKSCILRISRQPPIRWYTLRQPMGWYTLWQPMRWHTLLRWICQRSQFHCKIIKFLTKHARFWNPDLRVWDVSASGSGGGLSVSGSRGGLVCLWVRRVSAFVSRGGECLPLGRLDVPASGSRRVYVPWTHTHTPVSKQPPGQTPQADIPLGRHPLRPTLPRQTLPWTDTPRQTSPF